MKTGRCRRWMPWNSSIVNSNVRLYNSISKPTLDHLRSDFPIFKTYFGPPPKYLSDFKTYFGPPPKYLSDFRNLLRTTSEVPFRFPKPTLDHLRSGLPISKTYFGPPPMCLSDFRNLLRTTSEVPFRFPKPTLDHLQSAFPIFKTYFGPPPK